MTLWAYLERRAARNQKRWEVRQLQRSMLMVRGETFWQRVKMPTERQYVTLGLFAGAGSMLKMAEVHPNLWDVEFFKILMQGVVLTGLLNMVLAFHFAANKNDDTKSENTGKAFDALKAAAENTGASGDDRPTGASGDDRPTGKPGDPVHTLDEEHPIDQGQRI